MHRSQLEYQCVSSLASAIRAIFTTFVYSCARFDVGVAEGVGATEADAPLVVALGDAAADEVEVEDCADDVVLETALLDATVIV